jgi:hypothetical protein
MHTKELYEGAMFTFGSVLAGRLLAVYLLESRPALHGRLADLPVTAEQHKRGNAEAEKQVTEGERTSLHLTEEVCFISPVEIE